MTWLTVFQRDLLGIVIAIIGAVTVVLATNASNVRLNPEALVRAISQPAFIAYACTYVVGAVVLASLSQSEVGRQYVFVDIGLCAIFGSWIVRRLPSATDLCARWFYGAFNQGYLHAAYHGVDGNVHSVDHIPYLSGMSNFSCTFCVI